MISRITNVYIDTSLKT